MKTIDKKIGNRTYKIQQHDDLVCINCGDKGYIWRNTRMSNNFHVDNFKHACQHCQSGRRFRENEIKNSKND